jgi:hypothetical protein
VGKRSRLKRETTREQRLAEQRRRASGPGLQFAIGWEYLDRNADGIATTDRKVAVVEWQDAGGVWHERRFARYQDAQAHGYAAMRGEV